MKKIQTTCNYCSLDCNLDFYVENGHIRKVVPTLGYPVNDGFSCIKGLSLGKQQTVNRCGCLPKIRNLAGEWEEKSWAEGCKYVADELLRIKNQYGGTAIAGLSTGQMTLEELTLFGHVMRNFLGAEVDGNTRLCMATSVVAYKQSFGFDAPGFTLEDAELSDTLVFIGANPVVAHPVLWDRVRKNPDKTVIVIDPRRSETAEQADVYYPLKSKSDLTLLYVIAKCLIDRDAIDHAFIEGHTNHFEEFRDFVQDYPLERAVKATGLTEDQIVQLVDTVAKGKRVSFWWTMGVNQGYEAVRTAQAIINLALMTGNIGRAGTGPNSITGQSNAMGSRAFSNTAGLFGGGDFDNPARRTAVAKALRVPEKSLATRPTKTYNQIIEGIEAGEIKALWIVCTNPRHSWTNNETFARAIKKLELFIVQDIYDNTESAELAGVIFPVASGLKKEGTLINLERRLSAVRPVLPLADGEKTDYDVILEVGRALGMGALLDSFATPRDCFDAMKRCSFEMPLDITGVKWDNLTESKGVQWPFRQGEILENDQRRLFKDGKFFTPNQRANFIFEPVRENPLQHSEQFPLTFNTGRGSVGQWHTQTRTKEILQVMQTVPPYATVQMHSQTAHEYGIESGERVKLRSCNGECATFCVQMTDSVKPNELFAPIHYIECNALTPSVYDSYSKEPSYKATPVCIEGRKNDVSHQN